VPQVHIFIPIQDKTDPHRETERVREAIKPFADAANPVRNGGYTVGCRAASVTVSMRATVMTLDTADEEDTLAERMLRPISEALGRSWSRVEALGEYYIGDRRVLEPGMPRPVVYNVS